MNYSTIQDEIKQLDIAERILLAEEIWDSIVAEQERVPITQAQKNEIDRRINAYQHSPDKGTTWTEVNDKIKSAK